MNFVRLRSLSLVLLFEAVFIYSYFRICIHVCIHTGAGRGRRWVRRGVGKGWREEVKMKWNEGGRVYEDQIDVQNIPLYFRSIECGFKIKSIANNFPTPRAISTLEI